MYSFIYFYYFVAFLNQLLVDMFLWIQSQNSGAKRRFKVWCNIMQSHSECPHHQGIFFGGGWCTCSKCWNPLKSMPICPNYAHSLLRTKQVCLPTGESPLCCTWLSVCVCIYECATVRRRLQVSSFCGSLINMTLLVVIRGIIAQQDSCLMWIGDLLLGFSSSEGKHASRPLTH